MHSFMHTSISHLGTPSVWLLHATTVQQAVGLFTTHTLLFPFHIVHQVVGELLFNTRAPEENVQKVCMSSITVMHKRGNARTREGQLVPTRQQGKRGTRKVPRSGSAHGSRRNSTSRGSPRAPPSPDLRNRGGRECTSVGGWWE